MIITKNTHNWFDISKISLYYGLTLSFQEALSGERGNQFSGASHMNPCVGYHLTRVRQLTSSAVDGSFNTYIINSHNKGPLFINYRGLCLCLLTPCWRSYVFIPCLEVFFRLLRQCFPRVLILTSEDVLELEGRYGAHLGQVFCFK